MPARTGRRWRWLRWSLLLLLTTCLLAFVLSLSRTPAVVANAQPTAEQVRNARNVFNRVRAAQGAEKPRNLRASWQEMSAVGAMAGRAVGLDRVQVSQEGSHVHLAVSRRLPLGFWLNGHLFATPDSKGNARVTARVGRLPVPAVIVHAGIGTVLRWLQRRAEEPLSFEQIVQQLTLDQSGVRAKVRLPVNSHVVRTLSDLGAQEIDEDAVGVHYCRLVEAERGAPGVHLAGLVNRAFATANGTPADSRSIFIALSLMVAGMDVGSLPEGSASLTERCGTAGKVYTLQKRADLAKHWTVSAALTAYLGSDASLTLGTWKEISDSGTGGSGFSLVDLAADRSGTFVAQRGVQPEQAAQLQAWLAQVDEDGLLPLDALALAEGMTEQQFQMRYSSTDSAAFAAAVKRIDSELQILMR